jgi:hypothetical protein
MRCHLQATLHWLITVSDAESETSLDQDQKLTILKACAKVQLEIACNHSLIRILIYYTIFNQELKRKLKHVTM